jgi:hypothetical protein
MKMQSGAQSLPESRGVCATVPAFTVCVCARANVAVCVSQFPHSVRVCVPVSCVRAHACVRA